MDKLSVFSKKLGEIMDVTFDAEGVLVTPEGVPIKENDVVLAWNNSSDSWVDNGWNNSSSGWVDNGWSNSSDSWLDNGWSNSSDSWSDSSGGGGGCYITTACVDHMGLADDCHELSVLRKYRDKLVAEDESFRFKILEYYRKAPLIVQRIEEDDDRDMILEGLYRDMVARCVSLLESGQPEEAKNVYLDSYENLANRYLAS